LFGARFSKEVLGLGLALGLALALVEPISRIISDSPSWLAARSLGTRPETSRAAGYQMHLVPYGIDRGVCDRSALAADLKDGTIPAADMLIGNVIGAKMDAVDQECVSHALEFAPDQHRVLWRNSNNGLTYTVIATQTYQTDRGVYCREYSASTVAGGQPLETRERACRQTSGAWTALHELAGR